MSPFDPTAAESARARAAEQLRRMAHELMRGDHDAQWLDGLSERLGADTATMANAPKRERDLSPFTNVADVPVAGDGEEFYNSFDRPVSGVGNPWSLPLRVFRHGDRAVTDVEFDAGFEGAPGMVHGGFVAAVFDDLLGFTLMIERTIAFTAWLRVEYRAPTPLGQRLRFEAWVDRVEDRKMFLAARCLDGSETVIASCEALFIDVAERMDGFKPEG